MPRVVNCSESACFLKTPEGIGAKFCQECGASAAVKVTVTKAECPNCHTEIDDHARFCSECGNRVQSIEESSRVQSLLDGHVKREVTTGRGLTAAEARRIEEASRRPSRVSDPEREYVVDKDHAKIMGIAVPMADNKANAMAKGRRAIQNPKDTHAAGGLSGESKLPADYHEGVRVIPYRFSTPAKRGPQLVTGRGGTTSSHSASDDAFFQDDPAVDPVFQDDGDQSASARDVRATKARRKAASEAAVQSAKTAKPPAKRENCHECGRIMDENNECPHCIARYANDPVDDADKAATELNDMFSDPVGEDEEMSVEEMSKLWDSGPR